MGKNHISGMTEVKSDHILYTGRLYKVTAYAGQITLKRGVVKVT